MREIFSAFYGPTEDELKSAWKDATFVLDTNILLNLYRYPLVARKELLEVFKKLQHQLWIPFHVALEFQRNRLGVIAGQQRSFSEVKAALDSGVQTMTQKLSALQLTNRHSIIDAAPFLKEIESAVTAFKSRLDNLKGTDDVGLRDDIIRDQLDEIFKGRVGDPLASESLSKIQKEGELRFKCEMPPGYQDAEKEKRQGASFIYSGLQYEAKYGDLIVWRQLIEHAKAKGLKKVIFLTDDEKEDWWELVKVDGPKKVGPRPELREEIRREAGVEFFHMYNSEAFLRYAKKVLGAKVQQQSIDEVADVLQQNRITLKQEFPDLDSIEIEAAHRHVIQWLASLNIPVLELGNRLEYIDFGSGLITLNTEILFRIEALEYLVPAILKRIQKEHSAPVLLVLIGIGSSSRRAAQRWFSHSQNSAILRQGETVVYGEVIPQPSIPNDTKGSLVFTPFFAVGDLASVVMGSRRMRST